MAERLATQNIRNTSLMLLFTSFRSRTVSYQVNGTRGGGAGGAEGALAPTLRSGGGGGG